MKKFLLIIFIFILAFFIGLFVAKLTTPIPEKNVLYTTNVNCITKNNMKIKVEATLLFDNNQKKPNYKNLVKNAIDDACAYVFKFYDYKDIINNKSEITALTLEEIFNNLQEDGFSTYDFIYDVKEVH